MHVFVTGGTGVLGRATVQKLLSRGHEVTGLAHSDAAVDKLAEIGARPVRADLFTLETLTRAIAGSDAVLHLATRIPPTAKMKNPGAWRENDRIRAEGTRNLADAALATDVGVMVYPSVVFMYPDSGDRWIDASTAAKEPTPFLTSTIEAEAQVERFAQSGGRGVVLRMGWLYGPESSHTLEALAYAKKGIAAVMGRPDTYQSSIWDQDAAEAIVLAMESAPTGVYDVVDDEPVSRHDLVEAMASGVRRKKLRRLPGIITRMAAGATLSEMAGRSQRVSNQRFKDATGWEPTIRSVHHGWERLAG